VIPLLVSEPLPRLIYAAAGEVGRESETGRYLGDPIEGLTPNQLEEFDRGFSLFVKNWSVREGLGPNVNAHSCVACHRIPTPGGSGTGHETLVVRSPDFVDPAGGSVFPRFMVRDDGSLQERSLPQRITIRRTQGLFGLGLLEAVPVSVLLEYADANDADDDGISGRLVRVGEEFGRFGWKGNVPTIEAFVQDAFAVEMGLRSKMRADEIVALGSTARNSASVEVTPTQTRLVSQFIRFLGAPRPTVEHRPSRGRELFDRIDCAKCHRPSLETGMAPAPFGNQKLFAFTDLLLHDMGPELGDGLEEDGVSGQEFRTPPLWGIASTGPPYLHDGRAMTMYDAIIAHGGEAKTSARKFKMLSEEEQASLLRFLNSL
jgi:CxxC motif-containing protein (DUF1111 family)